MAGKPAIPLGKLRGARLLECNGGQANNAETAGFVMR